MNPSKYEIVDVEKLPKHFDAAAAESKWHDFWTKKGVYRFNEVNSKSERYAIDTPPPTASGSLHIGHIFSYVHTDIQARYQRMKGCNVFYPLGWDDNGLPTERRVQNYFHVQCNPHLPYQDGLKLEQANSKQRKERPLAVSRPNFIELCEEVTQKDEQIFKDLFQRVGLSVDWREEYATIDKRCRHLAQYSFYDLYKKGHIYQVDAPTMWDTDFQTAVAQAEVEDREMDGAYHHIEFAVEDSNQTFTIATTRPELLPACIGVAAHPDDDRYKTLFGKKAITPLFYAPVEIFPTPLADPDKGSGILMVCSFGDATDVHWWREQRLPLRQIVERNGRLKDIKFGSSEFPSKKPEVANQFYSELSGKNLKQARKLIVEQLQKLEGSATGTSAPLQTEPESIKHAVKFYEKGDRPLEFVSTRQWFVRLMDKKEQLAAMAHKIKWHPEHMRARMLNWTENLQLDWCISRQRYFGVSIPVWYPLDAKAQPIFDKAIVAEPDRLPVDPMTDCPSGYQENQRDQPNGFTGEIDVFDTWFTSSITPQIASRWILNEKKHEQLYPMDLRPQSHDIIRTWAFYTIAKSYLHEAKVPWKHIALSGFILDPDRKKMSKSKGNVVTPVQYLDEFSSDAVRYWAGNARLGIDMAMDEQVFKIGRRLITKIFNASKFVLSQQAEQGPITETLDQAFLGKLKSLLEKNSSNFEKYNFGQVLQDTEKFFWANFTDSYLELVKNRAKSADSKKAASAVASLRLGLKYLLQSFAPFMPFITEEVWSWAFAKETGFDSIHRSLWPAAEDIEGLISNTSANNAVFDVALSAFAAINRYRTEQSIARNEELKVIKLEVTQDEQKFIELIKEDLQVATKTTELTFLMKEDKSKPIAAVA